MATVPTRPLVMGVLNVTPDSFYDGGRYLAPDDAIEHGLAMVAEGVDIVDVGGESSRPGASPVAEDEELAGWCRWSKPWHRRCGCRSTR